jgi:hypothetical protein
MARLDHGRLHGFIGAASVGVADLSILLIGNNLRGSVQELLVHAIVLVEILRLLTAVN